MNKVKILFLAAYPDASPLKLDEEIRAITQKIRTSEYRDTLDLVSAWAVRPDDLLQTLNEHKPDVVHFSGHGSPSGEIILVDETLVNGKRVPKPVNPAAIKALFQALKDNVQVVILNACYARIQAEAIKDVIDCVIGMNSAIGDQAAITFAASFYRALGFGRSVKEAFEQGRVALLLEDFPEGNTPELLCKPGVDPAKVFLIVEKSDKYKNVAEKLLTFLENRRVLYNLVSEKCPHGVIESVEKIRTEAQNMLVNIPRDSILFNIIEQIEFASIEFLSYACRDCNLPTTCNDCQIYEVGCVNGLLEFRKRMGICIANTCSEFGLSIHGQLIQILPGNTNQHTPYNICPDVFAKIT